MKQILLAALLFIGMMGTGCKKEPCWLCEQIDHGGNEYDSTYVVCDYSEEEIRKFEADSRFKYYDPITYRLYGVSTYCEEYN